MSQDLKFFVAAGVLLIGFAAGCTQDSAPELLRKADAALAKGELRSAEIHLKNLLKEEESNVQARLLLARTYGASRNWPSALKEFRRANDLGAPPAQVAPGLMEALFYAEDPAAVIEQAGRLDLDDKTASAEVAVWSARAWMKRGAPNKAQLAFREALRSVPTLTSAKVGLLALQAREGNDARTRALEALAALLKDEPHALEALLLQAELRIASGDFKEARTSLEAATAASPSDIHARSALVTVALELQDRSAARAHLTELLARTPKWHVALTQLSQLDLLDGKRELARDGALEVLKLAPDYLPALSIAGSSMLAMGSTEQAETYARRMIKLAPTLGSGHQLLAATMLKRGEPDRALQVIGPLLQQNPADPRLLVLAGEAALRSGDARISAKYFARAAELDKEDPGKRVGLALARMGMGDRAGALEHLQTASSMTSASTAADQILIATLISERKFDRAQEAIEHLERKQAGAGDVPFFRARVALAKGDEGVARKYFAEALQVNPASLPAAASLAALDVAEGKVDEARRRYEAIIAADPKSAPAWLALAKLAAETGQPAADVISLLKRASEADPNNELAALALTEALLAQGKSREAVQVLQDGVKLNPGWIRAQEALAGAYTRTAEPERAHEIIDKLAGLKPDDAGLQFRLGTLKTGLRDYRGALARYQRALELEPKAVEPRGGVAQAQALLGRFDDALATVQGLQKDHPRNSVGWALEGDLYRTRQQWREASSALRKAVEIEPGQRAHALKLHDSLLRAGSSAEAKQLLKKWLEASPRDEKLNLYAGERDLADNNYAGAVRHYEIAAAANPGNAIAHNNLAWSLHQLKDQRAMAVAEEAYRLAPNSAAVVDTLATIMSENNKVQRGLELHKRAATLAPRSPDIRLKLAKALQAAGNKAEAKQELETVVSEFPNTPQATTARRLSAEL